MRLSVYDGDGTLVAEADLDSKHPLHEGPDGSLAGHAVGRFVPGPGFARIGPKVDAIRNVFAGGDVERALALSDDVDALGLWAMDPAGRFFKLSNVQFQQGGLLFFATHEP
jgi:hypothetical protein